MKKHFHRELDNLRKRLLTLCAVVEEMVRDSVEAVHKGDVKLAEDVTKRDDDVDRMELEIEEECLKILALHQPVAGDLRFVVAALKINNDIERIADLASKIAFNARDLAREKELKVFINFEPLAVVAGQMLKSSLDSLINEDTDLAREVCLSDDQANVLKQEIRAQVSNGVRDDCESVDRFMLIMGVARSLERIADLTTNIAEDVIYMIEGDIVRHIPDEKLAESLQDPKSSSQE